MKKTFESIVNARLSGFSPDAALRQKIEEQITLEGKTVKKRTSLALVFALALVLLTAAAFALTDGFGLFDLMGRHKDEGHADVQKEAFDLVNRDVARASFGHVDVVVTEAVYDGKYLRVVHSTRERDATAPFDGQAIWNGNFRFPAAEEDGVSWNSLDWAIVNGQDVNPLGEAGADAGGRNGETLAWIQYDLSELEPADTLKVQLPIRGRKSIENDELSFEIPATNLPGVVRLQPPAEVRFEDYSLKVTEFMLSPIRVYLTAEMTVDAGVPFERCDRILWGWMNGALADEKGENALKQSASGGGAGFYIENTQYDEKTFYERITDPAKPVRMGVNLEFMTAESYPDAFRFSWDGDALTIRNERLVND